MHTAHSALIALLAISLATGMNAATAAPSGAGVLVNARIHTL